MSNMMKLFGKAFRLSVRSTLSSLKSIFRVYGNGFGILKVYFFGGETQAFLYDSHGGKLSLKISKENVGRIISLGNSLVKFQNRYEVRNNEINFELWPNVFKSFKPSLTPKDLHILEILISKYIVIGERFDHDKYLVTDIDGLRWILREDSLAEDAIFGLLLTNCTEPEEHKWFLKALHESGFFVDVGANVGGYSVRACRMGVEVIAVEPDPDNCRVISLNLKLNNLSNAHLLRIAAGSREDIRQLYYRIDHAPFGYSLEQDEETVEAKCAVEVKPLDVAVPPFLGDKWINLLKVDAEGLEVEVLKGASNLLKRTRYIIVELTPSIEAKLLEVLNLLRPMGFELIDKVCRFPLYCNLFLRKCKQE
jgi:FkbM family methyltransferase